MSTMDKIDAPMPFAVELSVTTPSEFEPNLGSLGGILRSSSGQSIHLRAFHLFGRSQDCHTQLSSHDVSRVHCVLLWQDGKWLVQDKSTNGVWLNGKRLTKDQLTPLREQDQVSLSSKQGESFTLLSAQAPNDVLLSVDQPNIMLTRPFTKLAENYCVYFDHGFWHLDALIESDWITRKLFDGDTLYIAGHHYRLQASQLEEVTSPNLPHVTTLDDLTFTLHVSADEEEIQLMVDDNISTSTIQGHRLYNQLYLFLYLAKQYQRDQQLELEEAYRGWLKLDKIASDLKIEPENVRVRLHRLRNRLREAVSFSGLDACHILQLQSGEVRLNAPKLEIVKTEK